MQRISSNMDKLLGHMQRDIKFRKANKKIQYPVPRINSRLAPPRSAQEICTMKDRLKDEGKNIMQIAFLPRTKGRRKWRSQSDHARRGHPRYPR